MIIKVRNILGVIFFTFAALCSLFSLVLTTLYILGFDFDTRPLCSQLSPEQIIVAVPTMWNQFKLGISYILFGGGIITFFLSIIEFIRKREKGDFEVYGDVTGGLTMEQSTKFIHLSIVITGCILWTGFTYYWEVLDNKNCNPSDFVLNDLESFVLSFFVLVIFYAIPSLILSCCAIFFWMKLLGINGVYDEEVDR
ncbi:MAG: hypothetical protein AB4063_17190 [Crocosphaera sp.]